MKIRGGPWGGPCTGSMDRVHGVVHGPGPSGGPCFVYVARGTLTYILREIGDEISRQDSPMQKAVTPNRRLAIALQLYLLSPTAEYRTIGNLFGVSVAFVCACIKEVCEAIRNKMASETSQSFKTCMLSN